MKKLTFFKTLAMLCCVLAFQSCRKDRTSNTIENPSRKGQLISQETLLQHIQANRAFEIVSLDWQNAKQTRIEDKNVVRVPILNEDRTAFLGRKKSNLKLNSIGEASASVKMKPFEGTGKGHNTNYDQQHPPEVFFIEDTKNHKLSNFLLNFIPDDPKKAFGQDRVWTGRLVEWNLTGDTILMQKITNSKLIEAFALNQRASQHIDGLSNAKNRNADRKISGFWGDLWDTLGELVGWIGSLFGASEHIPWDFRDGQPEWRLKISFEWLTGTDSGSSGGGDGSYNGAGYPIYNSYIPGLIPSPYYGDPANNQPVSYPWDAYPNPHGPNNGASNSSDYSVNLQYLINRLNLTQEQINFLAEPNHRDLVNSLFNYLDENGETAENLEFANWAVNYIKDNSNETFESIYNKIIIEGTKYIISDNIRLKYPQFASMAKGLSFFLASNPKVLDALSKYSGFTNNQIMKLSMNGKGPTIEMSNAPWTVVANGFFNAKISENTIFLAEENIKMFNDCFGDYKAKSSLAFSLMVTILHETVHYGRFVNGMPDPNSTHDFGTKFEELGFGFNVDFKLNQPIIYKMYFLP